MGTIYATSVVGATMIGKQKKWESRQLYT